MTASSCLQNFLIEFDSISNEDFVKLLKTERFVESKSFNIMELLIAKAIVVVCLFVGTFVMAILPIKLMSMVEHTLDPSRRRWYKRAISWLNCFGGGVFLGACLLDLFPEVREQFDNVFKKINIGSSFPVAEFAMLFGFFLAFIVEQIVLSFQESRPSRLRPEERPLLQDSHVQTAYGSSVEGVNNVETPNTELEESSSSSESSFGHTSVHSIELEPHSMLRSIVLLMALSLHSIFEGLAIGLQPTIQELAQILAAVAIHKGIIAFSLGLALVQSDFKLKYTILLDTLFSITTPTGILIGMAITGMSNSLGTSLATGILQGIACGTFLFVTFFEVLPHEMNAKGHRLPKVMAIILGCAAVCGGLFLDPDISKPRGH
ncbi:hypothetical protein CHUAL_002537 [Chamberlinius hualienensis]